MPWHLRIFSAALGASVRSERQTETSFGGVLMEELVKALASYGVSRNIYCVNIDAVIAVILLKMLWRPFVAGEIDEQFLEYGAFTTFVYGRMVGEAAEIEDHTNRGHNMDTRTPASQCRFVN